MFFCKYCETLKNTILKNICERLVLILWTRIEITQAKTILINGNLWDFNFVNWHGYKEKFKEIAYKSKQMPGGKLSLLADEIVEWDLPRLDGVNFHSRKPGSFNHHLKFLLILLVSPRESLKYLHYFHSFRIINNYICHKILFDLLSKVFFYIAITTTTPTTPTTTTTTTWIFTLDSRSQICLV